jgi:hypothetical protein
VPTCGRRQNDLKPAHPPLRLITHWSVEHACHWSPDDGLGEDQRRVRAGHAAQNLGTLRRLALDLLKRGSTKKRGRKGKQRKASWDHSDLLRLPGVNRQPN